MIFQCEHLSFGFKAATETYDWNADTFSRLSQKNEIIEELVS